MDLSLFIEGETEKILKKYKSSKQDLSIALAEFLTKNPSLIKAVEQSENIAQIERLSLYKNAMKKFKKEVYYSLRTYHKNDGDTAVQEHISTKEREPYLMEFHTRIFQKYYNVSTILDVGGGVFPLTFPFEKYTNLTSYTWVDKDAKAFQELETVKNPRLRLFNHTLGKFPWDTYLPEGKKEFDLVLMVKFVSVALRTDKALLPFLMQVPTKSLFITAPKESMTKNESIEQRERMLLQKFVRLTGRKVVDTLDIENEFGFFLV